MLVFIHSPSIKYICRLQIHLLIITGESVNDDNSNPKVAKTTTDEKKTAKNDTDLMVSSYTTYFFSGLIVL